MKIIFFVLVFMSSLVGKAQDKPSYTPRLSFGRVTLYYGNGNSQFTTPIASKTALGNTVGLEWYVAPPYPHIESTDKFCLGWNWNNRIGWNFTNKQLVAFGEDIGIWGSYLFSPDVEAGLQYSFLGYNVYQNMSFLGSKIQPAIRWKNLQLTYTREGWGAFYGCIVSKEKDASNVNSFELAYYPIARFLVGIRVTTYTFGNATTREFSFNVGKNLGVVRKK